MELQCSVQHYHWGKLGFQSEVAQLAKVCNVSLSVEDNKSYAELWMGTHVNGPSSIQETNEKLSDWLQRNLDSLGPEVRKEFGDDLPFLFKVLSVSKALSIQAHPNKKHAEELHSLRPDLYKDPNHKPELAIALTPFEALCGFRPVEEIKRFIQALPELQAVLGQQSMKDNVVDENGFVKNIFTALMMQDATIIRQNLDLLVNRLKQTDQSTQESMQFSLLTRLISEFPGDVGCWCIYILNYLKLSPGEAIYLGPNVPHAYLYGDCVECMACSDNVVRAGLTPKYIDISTLTNMLIYDSLAPANVVFQPEIENSFTKVWRPPVRDFAVAEIKIPKNCKQSYNTIMRPSASILLVVSGKAKVNDSLDSDVSRGSVLYLKASRQLTIIPNEDCDEDLIIYQAMCNVF